MPALSLADGLDCELDEAAQDVGAARAGIERCYGIDCLGEFVRFGEQ